MYNIRVVDGMLNVKFVHKGMLSITNMVGESVQVEHSHVDGIRCYGPVPPWSWRATARSLGFRAQVDLHVQVCMCTVNQASYKCVRVQSNRHRTSVYVYSQTGIVQVCTCTVKQALYMCVRVQSISLCTRVYIYSQTDFVQECTCTVT